MLQAPPALLVAPADSSAEIDEAEAKLIAEVDECAASAIASMPSAESRRSYECVWRFYREWLDAQKPPLRAWRVRPKNVQSYITQMGREGKAKGTIGRAKSVLCTIYGSIVLNEYMESNPAREVKAPRVDSTPNTPWIEDDADVEKLLNVYEFGTSWSEHRDRMIIRLMLGMGFRRAEVARLTVENIDGDAISVVTKGGSEKLFGVPDWLVDELAEWRRFARIASGPLFPRRQDDPRPINGAGVYHIVRKCCAAVDIDVVSPHSLRRTATSYLRKHGSPLKPLQLMLGHAQEATTGRYDKHRDARANKPGEAFGKLVHSRVRTVKTPPEIDADLDALIAEADAIYREYGAPSASSGTPGEAFAKMVAAR